MEVVEYKERLKSLSLDDFNKPIDRNQLKEHSFYKYINKNRCFLVYIDSNKNGITCREDKQIETWEAKPNKWTGIFYE